jgi:hypothetical protein
MLLPLLLLLLPPPTLLPLPLMLLLLPTLLLLPPPTLLLLLLLLLPLPLPTLLLLLLLPLPLLLLFLLLPSRRDALPTCAPVIAVVWAALTRWGDGGRASVAYAKKQGTHIRYHSMLYGAHFNVGDGDDGGEKVEVRGRIVHNYEVKKTSAKQNTHVNYLPREVWPLDGRYFDVGDVDEGGG